MWQRPCSTEPVNSQAQLAPAGADELAGDLAPLLEQLGSPGGLAETGATTALLGCPPIESLPTLRTFLDAYRAQRLVPVELPAIFRAWQHASRGEARELLALDRQLATAPAPAPFAQASRHAGRDQLRRLRPLRDQRLVQRYLAAIEAGEADGWHTLVFGVTLAVYSLPPRQGLLAYARQTLAGFAHGAATRLKLSEADLASVVDSACADLPAVVNRLVDATPTPFLASSELRATIPA
jgi:urease accessory protein UreF